MLQLLSCSRTQNMKLGAAIGSQSYVEEHIGGVVKKWVEDYQNSTSCCIYSIYSWSNGKVDYSVAKCHRY